MFPFRVSNVIPDSSLASILGLRSRTANTEAVADFALVESGARELDWETATAAIARAKKTCKFCKNKDLVLIQQVFFFFFKEKTT